MSSENVWCARCHEEFPIATPELEREYPFGYSGFKMGLLYPIKRVFRKIRWRFESGTSEWACGNCILDLLDEEG